MMIFSLIRPAIFRTAAMGLFSIALTSLCFGAASANSLTSVSLRAMVGADERALLASFTIEGTASKQVLVRAAGPALANFGTAGPLADPVVTVHDGTGKVVASNDNWDSALAATFLNVGAFPFTSGSKDAAVIVTLPPGTYTARASSAGASTGVALLEVYEIDAAPRVAYVTSRAVAGNGANILIVGFTLTGTAPQKVIVRGLGPALGFSGTLADPQLTVLNAFTTVGSNDNWGGASEVIAASASAGLRPLDAASKDAAVVLTLAPGAYTAQVAGIGSSVGIAQCEVALVDGRDAQIAPALVTVPVPIGIAPGGSYTLGAPSVGKPAPDFQWRKNGQAIAGAQQSTLALTSFGAADAGNYSVAMTNSVGSVSSEPFVVSFVNGGSDNSPPIITTQPQNVTVTQGNLATFSVVATGSQPLSYSWRKNAVDFPGGTNATLTVNTSSSSAAGTYSVLVSNPYGFATSTGAVLTLTSLVFPTIITQPVGLSVVTGTASSFTVAATGEGALTYQWFFAVTGTTPQPIAGETKATLNFPSATAQQAGTYFVTVSGGNGLFTTSNSINLTVTSAPVAAAITSQPANLTVNVGAGATLGASIAGTSPVVVQWYKNGQAISGANKTTFFIPAVAVTDAGTYSVSVANNYGSTVVSRPVVLTVQAPGDFPLITGEPADQTVRIGAHAEFAIMASGSGPFTYQWRKNGGAIGGATNSKFSLTNVDSSSAGAYDCKVSNASGSTTSRAAQLSVSGRSYGGVYFGTFTGNTGSFALYVRDNNLGVLIGYATATKTALLNRAITIDENGAFSALMVPAGQLGGPATLNAVISDTNFVTGSVSGLGLTLAGAKSASTGVAQSYAGFYQAGAVNSSSVSYAVAGAGGTAFVLATSAAGSDGGLGTVDASGHLAVTSVGAAISGTLTLNPPTITVSVTRTGETKRDFIGAADARTDTEKLLNISTRSFVGTGGDVLIAGFVIAGDVPKQVLVRATGPALAVFGVGGTLAAPRLQIFNGTTPVAENVGWGTAADPSAITAAGGRSGAFPLTLASKDSALLLTLAPGGYSAVVSGVNDTTGVALVEVYDVSTEATVSQKVINIAARAVAGGGDNTLIAGFTIAGTVPKRVLVRGVGPALTGFGVGGALADPRITIQQGDTVLASNDNWSEGADASSLTAAAASVGAFALPAGSKDAALLVYLAPGGYSALVSAAGSATGVALVEVYEVP